MEPQTSTTEKILAAIETSHVTPRPKWYFVVRNILLWIPGLITTFLGAYAVSGILYGILHAHLENRPYITRSQIVSILAIPVVWIISFGIFSLITIAFLRRTSRGYRHPATQLLSLSAAGSVIIGILFYFFTSSSLAGPGLLYRYPTQHQQQTIWNDPADGRISGIVTAINGTVVTMTDFHGGVWNINIIAVPADEATLIKKGNAIRVVGTQTDPNTFSACRILQWELFPQELAEPSQKGILVHTAPPSCDTVLSHIGQ